MALFNFVQENAVAVRKLLFFTTIAMLATSNFEGAKADNMPLIYPDGTVVYGDWGLYRPGAIVPFVEGPYAITAPRYGAGYYPTNRYDPGAYRSPTPRRPIPPEPWFRTWGAQSDSTPATAPYEGPSVIYAPNFGGRERDKNSGGQTPNKNPGEHAHDKK
jgi:hypothetical protein